MFEVTDKTALHLHTWRCNHCEGTEKEFIEKGITLGIETMAFTCHAPFPGDSFRFRMKMEQLPEYLETLRRLRAEYNGQVTIKIGLEMEYVPIYDSYYQELQESGFFDLFILGQHFSLLSDGTYTFESKEKLCEARLLADGMIAGMESGYFDIVAHPDQIFRRQKRWDANADTISNEIKECATRTGVFLEKNISSMIAKRKKHVYWPEFWDTLPVGVRTVYGLDAHSVEELEEHYRMQVQLLGEMRKNVHIQDSRGQSNDKY